MFAHALFSIPKGKTVLGKELIITKRMVDKLLKAEFGEKMFLQDIWYDQETGIHIKVAKILGGKNGKELEEKGFKQVVDVSSYPVKEEIDDKVEKILQSEKILNKDW